MRRDSGEAERAMSTHHLDALRDWVAQQVGLSAPELEFIAGDASPRQYYRVRCHTGQLGVFSCIVMVSPPSENNEAFLHVGRRLAAAGIQTPAVLAQAEAQGWFLLEDFGDLQLLSALNAENVSFHYRQAFQVLAKQVLLPTDGAGIPLYSSSRLNAELLLFTEWFLLRLLKLTISETTTARFFTLSECLIASALEQPQVWVHRDFHSRNMMVLEANLGIIDFQDAVVGPITYDPVSLLKDCYIRWPRDQQLTWLETYYDQLCSMGHVSQEIDGSLSTKAKTSSLSNLIDGVSKARFEQWFDLMGLQRHLKVLGIFARLHIRDEKSAYLDDLPLVVAYVREGLAVTANTDPSIADFREWFEHDLMPVICDQHWYRPIDTAGWVL